MSQPISDIQTLRKECNWWSTIPRERRKVIERSLEVGWVAQVSANQITITSPHSAKSFRFGARGIDGIPLKSVLRSVEAWAEPDNPVLTPQQATAIQQELVLDNPADSVIPSTFAPMPPAVIPPTIISEKPALTHSHHVRGQGMSHPSKTTVERLWSDGHVDYACVICGKATDNRRGLGGAHWSMHIRKGEAEPVGKHTVVPVVDPQYTGPAYTKVLGYTRSSKLVDLVSYLSSVLTGSETPEQIAELVAEHLFPVQSDLDLLQQEHSPLTPEQILDRIRRLVDGGMYSELQQKVDALSLSLLQEQQHRIKAESTLNALAELAKDATSGRP